MAQGRNILVSILTGTLGTLRVSIALPDWIWKVSSCQLPSPLRVKKDCVVVERLRQEIEWKHRALRSRRPVNDGQRDISVTRICALALPPGVLPGVSVVAVV